MKRLIIAGLLIFLGGCASHSHFRIDKAEQLCNEFCGYKQSVFEVERRGAQEEYLCWCVSDPADPVPVRRAR